MPLYLKQKNPLGLYVMWNMEIILQLFYDMKLLAIYQIIELQTGIFMHKVFHMKLPYNPQKYFLFERPDYAVVTRQGGSFRQTYVCTRAGLCFRNWY